MELENQVCTLEQAKNLNKLLGDDAPASLWVWWFDEDNQEFILLLTQNDPYLIGQLWFPAYTGDELGILLPGYLILETNKTCLRVLKFGNRFMCDYQSTNLNESFTSKFAFMGNYESPVKADMLIYLLEQKLIDPDNLKL